MKKRVLIVISSIKIGGGAERIASSLGNELQSRGYDIRFMTFYRHTHDYRISGKHICLNEAHGEHILLKFHKVLKRAMKIADYCRQEKIDVCISFMEASNFPALLSRMRFGNRSKIILSERNNPLKQPKIMRIFIKRMYNKADCIVSVSTEVDNILREKFGIENSKVIPNFKDTAEILASSKEKLDKRFESLFDGSVTFLNIGRLHAQKGHKHLIVAFKAALDRCRDKTVKLIIIGEGESRKDLDKLINNLGMEKNIFLLGKLENVYPIMKKIDCFVLSSLYEGMPNTVLEALTMNKMVISTDCVSGPREILCPEIKIGESIKYPYYGRYGVLVKTFDEKSRNAIYGRKTISKEEEDLADVMAEVIKSDVLRKRYSKVSERIMDFDRIRIVDSWESIIK